MAMVVKNNMSAVKTLNVLNANSAALAKDLRQVATGMKVNSAADDNSGYAISERMQVRIRALEQADQNTQNGANMLKVAEGAVSSTVDILKTMKEKAINAANDSNTDADRATIQKELDQSIDQIDDNALITYNSKTLVDGSRMAKGVSTRNTFSNQSLSKDTKAGTKLTELADRNGNGLNIQTTDTLTISYVIQGRMYTTDIDIDEKTTLQKALEKAAEPYFDNSPLGKIINSTYDSSVNSAEVVHSATLSSATATYGTDTYDVATALRLAQEDYDTKSGYVADAKRNAGVSSTTADSAFNSVYGGWYVKSDGNSALVNPLTGTVPTDYVLVSSLISDKADAKDVLDAKQTEYDNVELPARSTMNSSIVVADAEKSTAISVALETKEESLGELIPYKFKLGEDQVIGKDAFGDTVYTANRENAITITAASAGISYQLSGITFSVSDSKGLVKKSVNAALDNFTETIRAVNKSNDNAITLQMDAKANQTIRISLTDMRSEALGLKSSDGVTLSVATQKHANAAVNVLDNAIQKALNQQTDIGAVANRMEQTSNNLHIARDNVQASESTIRDADMAKAMTSYTKNNILLQAAQSMLAQANQSSSNVLSLLQ